METIYDFSALAPDGAEVPFSRFRGQVLLIVNVASKCGFTPQYKGLEELHRAYAPRGFSVIGFPCNQFGQQEPGSDEDIAEFCETNFGITFPLMSKVDVNGPNAVPIYVWLRKQKGGLLTGAIKWNFTKFLVGRAGTVIAREPPTTPPGGLRPAIEKALDAPLPA